jgi:hypothetical protein
MNKRVHADKGLAWSFTNKRYTPWGGLRIFEEMLRRLGWEEALRRAPLPQPGSNRGIDPVLMVKGFLVTIWTGGGRLPIQRWYVLTVRCEGFSGWSKWAA